MKDKDKAQEAVVDRTYQVLLVFNILLGIGMLSAIYLFDRWMGLIGLFSLGVGIRMIVTYIKLLRQRKNNT